MRCRSAAGASVVLLLLTLSGCIGLLAEPTTPLHEALLLDQTYTHVVVEVDHAPGRAPCPDALQALVTHLRWTTAKHDVVLTGPTPIPGSDGDHSNGDIGGLAARHADPFPGGMPQERTTRLHVLYLDGHAARADGGHAAGRTLHDRGVIAVFPDAFAQAHRLGGAPGSAACDVERTVLLHELGHALGLVNRGVPMLTDREAPDHAGHSTNPESVMHPTIRLAPNGLLLQDLPRGFDRADLADLAAFRDHAA